MGGAIAALVAVVCRVVAPAVFEERAIFESAAFFFVLIKKISEYKIFITKFFVIVLLLFLTGIFGDVR